MKKMQIASMYKNSDNCEASKEKNVLGKARRAASNNNRTRNVTKFRPSKLRQRQNGSSHHHRLDHTYAVNVKVNKIQTIIIDDDDDDPIPNATEKNRQRCENEDIGLKSSWLRNLCLEYQPTKSLEMKKVVNGVRSEDDCSKKKFMYMAFDEINGTLKQYERNRKVHKRKSELDSSIFDKSNTYLEEKKRWIAALALIELAQSK